MDTGSPYGAVGGIAQLGACGKSARHRVVMMWCDERFLNLLDCY